MKTKQKSLDPNKIVQYLDKPADDFTRDDLIKYIEENGIEAVNLRFAGGDGRLKTLNFVITSNEQLDRLLSAGERVDGSSIFTCIDSASSDLYIIPRYRTAYVNPFSAIPTVDLLCAFYTSDGVRFASSSENTLKRAHDVLKERTGLTMEAMGELEYYVLYDGNYFYPTKSQRGYLESSPFSKWEDLRYEAMHAIAQAGGRIKYAHSEVGHISGEELEMDQDEIEFTPVPIEDAADQIVIARWVLRMIGYKYGVTISFAPKLSVGHAGSGLHVHTRLIDNGKNAMVDGNKLSETAKKVIAGYLDLASSLTAFGNTVPTSYLRLTPEQEAPTNICWGDRNRSVLVRVPLGWRNVDNMIRDANPKEENGALEKVDRQTVEFRCPDGSAHIHLLMAGLAVAARHGLEMKNALEIAEKLYVDVNIFDTEHKQVQEGLPKLPESCWDSAEKLRKDRSIYEKDDVFTSVVIDEMVRLLQGYNDKDLSERFYVKGEQIRKLIEDHLHCS